MKSAEGLHEGDRVGESEYVEEDWLDGHIVRAGRVGSIVVKPAIGSSKLQREGPPLELG